MVKNGKWTDEKPEAFTNQGAKGAHIAMVPAKEQQSAYFPLHHMEKVVNCYPRKQSREAS